MTFSSTTATPDKHNFAIISTFSDKLFQRFWIFQGLHPPTNACSSWSLRVRVSESVHCRPDPQKQRVRAFFLSSRLRRDERKKARTLCFFVPCRSVRFAQSFKANKTLWSLSKNRTPRRGPTIFCIPMKPEREELKPKRKGHIGSCSLWSLSEKRWSIEWFFKDMTFSRIFSLNLMQKKLICYLKKFIWCKKFDAKKIDLITKKIDFDYKKNWFWCKKNWFDAKKIDLMIFIFRFDAKKIDLMQKKLDLMQKNI